MSTFSKIQILLEFRAMKAMPSNAHTNDSATLVAAQHLSRFVNPLSTAYAALVLEAALLGVFQAYYNS